MHGHWLPERLGKQVLRPRGIGLTRALLARADGTDADVLELAPGLGCTAAEILVRRPPTYLGAEQDRDAASSVRNIVSEASRVLRPGGRYAIHELALTPDTIAEEVKTEVRQSIARAIKVNARPLTVAEWTQLLADHGLVAEHVATAPMALLQPRRLIADEGLLGAPRFAKNLLTHRDARRRVLIMRRTFRRYHEQLTAVAIVAHKPEIR